MVQIVFKSHERSIVLNTNDIKERCPRETKDWLISIIIKLYDFFDPSMTYYVRISDGGGASDHLFKDKHGWDIEVIDIFRDIDEWDTDATILIY